SRRNYYPQDQVQQQLWTWQEERQQEEHADQGGVDVVRFRNTAEDTADVLIGCRAVQTATVGWLFGVLVVLVRHRSSLLLMGYVFFSTPIIKRIRRSKYIRNLP